LLLLVALLFLLLLGRCHCCLGPFGGFTKAADEVFAFCPGAVSLGFVDQRDWVYFISVREEEGAYARRGRYTPVNGGGAYVYKSVPVILRECSKDTDEGFDFLVHSFG